MQILYILKVLNLIAVQKHYVIDTMQLQFLSSSFLQKSKHNFGYRLTLKPFTENLTKRKGPDALLEPKETDLSEEKKIIVDVCSCYRH